MLSSLLTLTAATALLAALHVDASFNCSMNVDVNSRSCPDVSCAVTGQYLRGQIISFDCVEPDTIHLAGVNGSVWWARDPKKDWVPVGNMEGIDGDSCDTHLGLCVSLPSSLSSAVTGPGSFVPFPTSSGITVLPSMGPPGSSSASSASIPAISVLPSMGPPGSSSASSATTPLPSSSSTAPPSNSAASPPSPSPSTSTTGSATSCGLGVEGLVFSGLAVVATAGWLM